MWVLRAVLPYRLSETGYARPNTSSVDFANDFVRVILIEKGLNVHISWARWELKRMSDCRFFLLVKLPAARTSSLRELSGYSTR